MRLTTTSGRPVVTHDGRHITVSLEHGTPPPAVPATAVGWTDLATPHPDGFSPSGLVGGALGQHPAPLAGVPIPSADLTRRIDCAHLCCYRSIGLTDNVEVGVLWSVPDAQAGINQVGPAAFVGPDFPSGSTAVAITFVEVTTSTATVTAPSHGFSVGNQVYLSGLIGPLAALNHTYTITSTSTHTFTVAVDELTFSPCPPILTTQMGPPRTTDVSAVTVSSQSSSSTTSCFAALTSSVAGSVITGAAVQLTGFTGSLAYLNGSHLVVAASPSTFVVEIPTHPDGTTTAAGHAAQGPTATQHRPMGLSSVCDISLAAGWYELDVFHGPSENQLEIGRYPYRHLPSPIVHEPNPVVALGDHWVTMHCVGGQVAGYVDGARVWGPIDRPAWSVGRDAWGFHAVQLQFPVGLDCFASMLASYSANSALGTVTFTTTARHVYLPGEQIHIRGEVATVPAYGFLNGTYTVSSINADATEFTVPLAIGGHPPTGTISYGINNPFVEAERNPAWLVADHQSPVQILDWYARPCSQI